MIYVIKKVDNLSSNFGDKHFVLENIEFNKGKAKVVVPFTAVSNVIGAKMDKVKTVKGDSTLELSVPYTEGKVKIDVMIIGIKALRG